jgi:sulfite reductase (NADPH) flavoprotein alpha-component
MSTLSLDLHTGRASIILAIILAIASGNILFFIYTGFALLSKDFLENLKINLQLKKAVLLS